MAIAQILKLGLPSFEITLPDPSQGSRIFIGPNTEEISKTGRAVDGTRKKDYVNTKKSFIIEYGALSEANVKVLEGIYALQAANPTINLNFIYTEQAATPITISVYMSPIDRGVVKPIGVFYYNDIKIELTEV